MRSPVTEDPRVTVRALVAEVGLVRLLDIIAAEFPQYERGLNEVAEQVATDARWLTGKGRSS